MQNGGNLCIGRYMGCVIRRLNCAGFLIMGHADIGTVCRLCPMLRGAARGRVLYAGPQNNAALRRRHHGRAHHAKQ